MKKLTTIALFLASSVAIACPNLAGNYTQCTTGNLSTDADMEVSPFQNITQSGKTVTVTDSSGTESFVLGQNNVETFVQDGVTYTVTLHPVCVNSSQLQINSSFSAKMPDGTVYSESGDPTYVKMTAYGMEYNMFEETWLPDGTTITKQHIVTCRKN